LLKRFRLPGEKQEKVADEATAALLTKLSGYSDRKPGIGRRFYKFVAGEHDFQMEKCGFAITIRDVAQSFQKIHRVIFV
jgi:hypothetical protein